MTAVATGVVLASMGQAHLDAVHAIETIVHGRPWSREQFVEELRHPDDRRYLVALHDGEVVGYGGVQVIAGDAHVTTVAVRPDARRRGIGSRLVAALLDEGRSRGATAATLEVRASNRPAQELYRRFGFAPVGVRRAYYDDTGEDALVMWLHDLGDR